MEEDKEALPPGWEAHFSNTKNRKYYYNAETNRSVWRLEDIIVSEAELQRREPVVSKKRKADSKAEPSSKDTVNKRAKKREGQISVAIIVPFRDLHVAQRRKEHLNRFIPHMENFLSSQEGIYRFHVYIIEQTDDGRKFNRGKLLNIGFDLACKDEVNLGFCFDSFIFHDVDLLPVGSVIGGYYAKYPRRPIHIARCWNRYNANPKYFGGVVAFSKADYQRIDGFPNIYWGWGGEDDELQIRVKHARLSVESPSEKLSDALIDLENMNLQEKLSFLRQNREWKCNMKWEVSDELKKYRKHRTKPFWWGLKNIDYKVKERDYLGKDQLSSKITVDVLENTNKDGTVYRTILP